MDKRCPAMINAGIEDAESQEGIDFCLQCPYPNGCIVFENGVKQSTTRRLRNQRIARELKAAGLTVEQIAIRLNKSKGTIERYLK